MQRIPGDNPDLKHAPIKGIKQKCSEFPNFPSTDQHITILASLPRENENKQSHALCATCQTTLSPGNW